MSVWRWGNPCTHTALPSRERTLVSGSFPPSLNKINDRLPCAENPSVSKKGVTRVNIVGLTWSETAAPLSEVCQRLAQVHSAREAAGPPEAFAGWKGSQQGLLRPAADHLWIPTRNGAAGILGTQVYETWWLAMFWAGGLPAPIFLWASLRSS